MNENLKKIKDLCKNMKFTGNQSDEYMFNLNCVDYFFFGKNIGEVDIKDGFTDGAGDGGIDFIYDDGEKMYLIQGKSQSDLKYNDIRDLFMKILETVNNFSTGNTDDYNSNLKAIYKNTLDKLDDPEIEFVLFTNTELDKSLLSKIEQLNHNGELENYKLVAYGKDEIESKQLTVDGEVMSVDKGELTLETKNYLEYQDGRGAIFTIKAYSLKDLYEKKKDDGLFGYNLREQISQANVDDEIDKTIAGDKDNFWFYNNGITIGCSDFYQDGNKLKLYNFSVINGAQTTSKIGKSNLIKKENDFSLICKVIKSENSLDDAFIRKVSEASNSQKPIKPRDLKSNSAEQKILQNNFIDNGKHQLAVEIKRGVKPINSRNVESWERVTNEYVGQVILSAQYQKPGTARSEKKKIFDNDPIYTLIFSKDKVKKYDYDSIYELVRLAHLYDQFKLKRIDELDSEIKKTSEQAAKDTLTDEKSICNNAKFVTLSIISYYLKRYYFKMKDRNDDKFNEPIITGSLSLNYNGDDYTDRLYDFFSFVINRLTTIYSTNRSNLGLTSVSNFFKTDKNYKEYIIPAFEKCLTDRFDKARIDDCITMFDTETNKTK